ncbi:MAG: hypothetical protein QOJ40_2714, partial [Verrucomicrobiota bacterium]
KQSDVAAAITRDRAKRAEQAVEAFLRIEEETSALRQKEAFQFFGSVKTFQHLTTKPMNQIHLIVKTRLARRDNRGVIHLFTPSPPRSAPYHPSPPQTPRAAAPRPASTPQT